MNITAVISKVLSACLISVLPFTTAFPDDVTDDFSKHRELRATTNISGKKLNGIGNIKQIEPMKVQTKEGRLKGSQILMPLIFEKNVGQTDEKIEYLLRQQNYAMYFTENSFITAMANPRTGDSSNKAAENKPSLLKMSLVNAQARNPEGVLRVKTRINQYIGADKKKWLIDIPGYSQLHYKGVYKGIDMLWKSKEGFPEYQFNVAGNTSEKSIRIKFNSTAPLSIDKNNLKITLPNGTIFHSEPQFFEEVPGGIKPLEGQYVLINNNEIGFKAFNRTQGRNLVIDPTVFVTTRSVDAPDPRDRSLPNIKTGFDIESHGSAVFVSGISMSLKDFGSARVDAFILKMESPLDRFPPASSERPLLILPSTYITYIGGSESELNAVISNGNNGEIYLGGTTKSDDFPTPGTTFRDSPSLTGESNSDIQAFIGKLSGDGTLLLGTMIGKGSEHNINDIKFSEDSIYVAGVATNGATTSSSDATEGVYRKEVKGLTDGFVSKLDAELAGLEYFTYLGSEHDDRANSRGADSIYGLDVYDGRAYLAGTTASGTFFTSPRAVQSNSSNEDCKEDTPPSWSCNDGFVTVLNETGTVIDYSTFYGGNRIENEIELVYDISVDDRLAVAITGTIKNAREALEPGSDPIPHNIFVAKLTPFSGDERFIINKIFDAPSEDSKGSGVGNAIHIDKFGSIHVTGEVSREGLAVGNANVDNLARSTVLGESDMFYMFIPPGNETGLPNLLTYFGGGGADIGQGISTRLHPTTGLPCVDIVGHLNADNPPPDFDSSPLDLGVYRFCISNDDLNCNIFDASGSTFTKRAVRTGSNETIDTVAVGEDFTYVIEIFNSSKCETEATLRDPLPSSVSVAGNITVTDGSCSSDGSNEVNCNIRLAANLTTEIRIPVTLAESFDEGTCPSTLANRAILNIGENYPFVTRDVTTNVVSCPDPIIIIDGDEFCDERQPDERQECEDGFVCARPAPITEQSCLIDWWIFRLFCEDDGPLTPRARCLDENQPGITPWP